jgi:hypothetical protein
MTSRAVRLALLAQLNRIDTSRVGWLDRTFRDPQRQLRRELIGEPALRDEELVAISRLRFPSTQRLALGVLTSKRMLLRHAYKGRAGYGPIQAWATLDEVAGLALSATSPNTLALAIRRNSPPALSRSELPFSVTILVTSGPADGQPDYWPAALQALLDTNVATPFDIDTLHRPSDGEVLHRIFAAGTPERAEVDRGLAAVQEWSEQYGEIARQRMDENRDARRATLQDEIQREARRMQELHESQGTPPPWQET